MTSQSMSDSATVPREPSPEPTAQSLSQERDPLPPNEEKTEILRVVVRNQRRRGF